MPRAIIQVYDPNTTQSEVFDLPISAHVTVTGKEDHFALAVRDVHMLEYGMREILTRQQDSVKCGEKDKAPARHIIRVKSISMD